MALVLTQHTKENKETGKQEPGVIKAGDLEIVGASWQRPENLQDAMDAIGDNFFNWVLMKWDGDQKQFASSQLNAIAKKSGLTEAQKAKDAENVKRSLESRIPGVKASDLARQQQQNIAALKEKAATGKLKPEELLAMIEAL